MSELEAARATELLGRAPSARVLVVGDVMLDRYLSGRVERVSPEAPVPVIVVEEERTALGGAGNVAANVTALGAACAVVGVLGRDAEGEQVLSRFRAGGIDTSGIATDSTRPTTVKTRVRAKPQQIVRLDREVTTRVGAEIAAKLVHSVEALAPHCDAIVVQDYDKGVMAPEIARAVLLIGGELGLHVVVDPKRTAFFQYQGATVFKPNRRELEDALGEPIDPESEGWMEDVRVRLGCRHLLVTLGEHGMALQTEEGRLLRLPAAAREVYDVSGAGDTVSATVAVALACGATVTEAAALANHAAAAAVQRTGAGTVSPGEIAAHVHAGPD